MKSELEKIRNELPNFRENQQLKYFTDLAINHLTQNGVTLEDIININGIFTRFANNELLLTENQGIVKTGKESMPSMDRSIRWKIFIEKLKELGELGDINSNIIKQKDKLKQLEKEVEEIFFRHKHKWQDIDPHYNSWENLTQTKSLSLMTCLSTQIYGDMQKTRYYNNPHDQITKIKGQSVSCTVLPFDLLSYISKHQRNRSDKQ